MMKKLLIVHQVRQVGFAALLVNATLSLAWAQRDCRVPEYKNYVHKKTHYAEINAAGSYCLNKDLYSPRVFRWMEGGEEDLGESLFVITADHVNLDLMGHEVNKQWKGSTSTMVAGGTNAKGQFNTQVNVRNGTLVNRTGNGFTSSPWGSDADWPLLYRYAGHAEDGRSKKFVDPMSKYFTREDFEAGKKKKPAILAYNKVNWSINRNDLSNFPSTKHQLENLKIAAAGNEKSKPDWKQDLYATHGVVISGAQNIIRNCTIEVTHTDAGIYLFGPNQVIENNTIIFKGHLPQGMSAPIRLSLADGSIIRNNTIIVQSEGANKPAAAISLIDSRNVVIENNTIEGVETIYRSWDELPEQKTSVQEKDNRFKKGWKLF